ncbi:MAG: MurR/RpiR family transcriptional regulator [Anaerolineae bacterium]|nr:MurR/RpiR family transcriptional regulator [Anaerolineae bacterium]
MFRERIGRRYSELSPGFKRLADFVLTSHQRVAFMSASRLARHLDLDVATVTRFAQALGYDGFTELIREIQEQVLDEMRQARVPITGRLEATKGSPINTMWQDWGNLEQTIQEIRPERMAVAVEALRMADHIYIVAESVGIGLAQVMASYLSMIKPDTVVLNKGPFDTAIELKDLTPQDVVVGIGFTNYAYSATRALQYGRGVGAKTIGIVAQAGCPIAEWAEILFICSEVEGSYTPSPTGVAAIVFALVNALHNDDPEKYHRELMRFQKTYESLIEGTPRAEVDVEQDLIGRFQTVSHRPDLREPAE